ncbi:hypothetical protein ACIG5E_07095 [Kitasatospora sp. NPDC053057]|uniref:hypothetical protein n=1 Tax=Kitasatospora sp. NPDC053057 TaxID=3364062 RepID=UPI0037C72A1E
MFVGTHLSHIDLGHCATDLNHHSGPSSVEEDGRRIARQLGEALTEPSGQFFHPEGGRYPW